jgi:hypothetical protein
MSSLVGHSLVACTVYGVVDCPWSQERDRRLWLIWLIWVAIAPDLDYVIPRLSPYTHQGLRITHSLVSCQILPFLTLLGLRLAGHSPPPA